MQNGNLIPVLHKMNFQEYFSSLKKHFPPDEQGSRNMIT